MAMHVSKPAEARQLIFFCADSAVPSTDIVTDDSAADGYWMDH
jgi:hypothetical protein